jgi:hypothetical protein
MDGRKVMGIICQPGTQTTNCKAIDKILNKLFYFFGVAKLFLLINSNGFFKNYRIQRIKIFITFKLCQKHSRDSKSQEKFLQFQAKYVNLLAIE